MKKNLSLLLMYLFTTSITQAQVVYDNLVGDGRVTQGGGLPQISSKGTAPKAIPIPASAPAVQTRVTYRKQPRLNMFTELALKRVAIDEQSLQEGKSDLNQIKVKYMLSYSNNLSLNVALLGHNYEDDWSLAKYDLGLEYKWFQLRDENSLVEFNLTAGHSFKGQKSFTAADRVEQRIGFYTHKNFQDTDLSLEGQYISSRQDREAYQLKDKKNITLGLTQRYYSLLFGLHYLLSDVRGIYNTQGDGEKREQLIKMRGWKLKTSYLWSKDLEIYLSYVTSKSEGNEREMLTQLKLFEHFGINKNLYAVGTSFRF